jgi:hypothetical protein
MNAELIKQQLGDLINQMTPENFGQGYDPITDLIDKYDVDFSDDNEEMELNLFYENNRYELMKLAFPLEMDKSNDSDYYDIYNFEVGGTVFHFSKRFNDIFKKSGRKLPQYDGWFNEEIFWYFKSLSDKITEECFFRETVLDAEEDFYFIYGDKFVPFVENEPNDLIDFND